MSTVSEDLADALDAALNCCGCNRDGAEKALLRHQTERDWTPELMAFLKAWRNREAAMMRHCDPFLIGDSGLASARRALESAIAALDGLKTE